MSDKLELSNHLDNVVKFLIFLYHGQYRLQKPAILYGKGRIKWQNKKYTHVLLNLLDFILPLKKIYVLTEMPLKKTCQGTFRGLTGLL